MKRFSQNLFLWAIGLFAVSIVAIADPDSTLATGTYEVMLGQEVEVTVSVNSPELFSMVLAVGFDKAIVEYVDSTADWEDGETDEENRVLASGDGLNAVLNEAEDQLSFSAIVIGTYPDNIAVDAGDGVVLRFRFRAVGTGVSALTFSGMNFGNAASGLAETVTPTNGQVTVPPLAVETAIPGPATGEGTDTVTVAGPTSVAEGVSQEFTVTIGGGKPAYHYSWALAGNSVGADSASFTYTPGHDSIVHPDTSADKVLVCQITDSAARAVATSTWQTVRVADTNRLPDLGDATIALSGVTTSGVGGGIGTDDAIKATVTEGTASDQDTEDGLGYEFVWTDAATRTDLRTSTPGAGVLEDTLPGGTVAKGRTVTVTVRALDYANGQAVGGESTASTSDTVDVVNTPPAIASSAITPDPGYVTSTLTATPSGYDDDDGEALDHYTYAWSIQSGRSFQPIGGNTPTLSNEQTGVSFVKGDQIKVAITPNDGTDDGTAVESTALTVSNSTPTEIGQTGVPAGVMYVQANEYTTTVLSVNVQGHEDQTFDLNSLVADADTGDTFTFAQEGNSPDMAAWDLNTATGVITFTPTGVRGPGEYDTSVTFAATDSDATDPKTSSQITFSLEVRDNQLPALTPSADADPISETGSHTFSVSATDSDGTVSTFTWTVNGTQKQTGGGTGDPKSDQFQYDPNYATVEHPAASANVEVKVEVTDNLNGTSSHTWTIQVTDVNRIPDLGDATIELSGVTTSGVGGGIGTDDAIKATVTEGTASDQDTEDGLGYEFVWTDAATRTDLRTSTPGAGVLEDTLPGGTVAKGRTVTVTVRALDYANGQAVGGESTASTSDTVDVVNTPPIAADDTKANAPSAETDEDSTITILAAELLANDTDDDAGDDAGFTIAAVSVTNRATLGAVSLVAGNIRYEPNGQFDTMQVGDAPLTDEFTYTVSDNDPNAEGTHQAQVTVTVNGVNDLPEWTSGARMDGETEEGTQTDTKKYTATVTGDPTDADWDDDLTNLKVYFRWTNLVDQSVRYLDGSTEFTPSSRSELLYTDIADGTSRASVVDNADKAHTFQVECFAIDQRNAICAKPLTTSFGAPPWFPLLAPQAPVMSNEVNARRYGVTITGGSDSVSLSGEFDDPNIDDNVFSVLPEFYLGAGNYGLRPGTTYSYDWDYFDQPDRMWVAGDTGVDFAVPEYGEPGIVMDLQVDLVGGPQRTRAFTFTPLNAAGFMLWVEKAKVAEPDEDGDWDPREDLFLDETFRRKDSNGDGRVDEKDPFPFNQQVTRTRYIREPGLYRASVRGFNPLAPNDVDDPVIIPQDGQLYCDWVQFTVEGDVPPASRPRPPELSPIPDTIAIAVTLQWSGETEDYILFVEGPRGVLVNRVPVQGNTHTLTNLPTGTYNWSVLAALYYTQTRTWVFSPWPTADSFVVEDDSGKPSAPIWHDPPHVVAGDLSSVTFGLEYGPIEGTSVEIQIIDRDAFESTTFTFARNADELGTNPPLADDADVLQTGRWYHYRARAMNAQGDGPWTPFSTTNRYRVQGVGPAPEDVKEGDSPQTVVGTSITFSFDKGAGTDPAANLPIDIEIYDATNFRGFPLFTVTTDANGEVTLDHTTVAPIATEGVMYYYRVRHHAVAGDPEPWTDWYTYVP